MGSGPGLQAGSTPLGRVELHRLAFKSGVGDLRGMTQFDVQEGQHRLDTPGLSEAWLQLFLWS